MINQPKFAITFGRTDFPASEGLRTIFVATEENVRSMATQFIKVIPAELDSYEEDIVKWDGNSDLKLEHQDDDTFLFYATPVKLKTDTSDFDDFVSEFAIDDGDKDDEDAD